MPMHPGIVHITCVVFDSPWW